MGLKEPPAKFERSVSSEMLLPSKDYSKYLATKRTAVTKSNKKTAIPISQSFHEEDLIICIAIWTLYKLCARLTSDEVRVISIASLNKLLFTSLLELVFKDFGRPNGFPNSVFEAFSLMLFFIAFEHPICVNFSRLPTRKIVIFPKGNNDFCKICVFDKNRKYSKK